MSDIREAHAARKNHADVRVAEAARLCDEGASARNYKMLMTSNSADQNAKIQVSKAVRLAFCQNQNRASVTRSKQTLARCQRTLH